MILAVCYLQQVIQDNDTKPKHQQESHIFILIEHWPLWYQDLSIESNFFLAGESENWKNDRHRVILLVNPREGEKLKSFMVKLRLDWDFKTTVVILDVWHVFSSQVFFPFQFVYFLLLLQMIFRDQDNRLH